MAKYLKVKKVILKKSTSSFLLIIFGLLSIIMLLLTLYGSSSGNFMITTDPDTFERGIILSTNKDFKDYSPRLFATSMSNVDNITYDSLSFQKVIEAEGDYIDPYNTYLAYTFYLKNNGKETVDIEHSLIIQEVFRRTEEAVRFILIEDGTIIRLFRKPDATPTEYEHKVNREPDEIIEFTGMDVFKYLIVDFKPEEVRQFSIILYLEGNDPDCTDELMGGSLKASMQFKIVEDQE